MSIQPPKIDNRSYEDLVAQTVRLVQHYTALDESKVIDNKLELLRDRTLAQDIKDAEGKIIAADTLIDELTASNIAKITDLTQISVRLKGWCKPEKNDAGLALIRIFDRMVATVSDRLNRVPEKNFLAFLDLLGTQILSPQPARVPLTFSLASGVPETTTALVPAYTQVAAPPIEGEEEETTFETETDLIVTSVELQAVCVRDLAVDRYSDRTLEATGKKEAAFLSFEGNWAIEHSLYIACDRILGLPETKTVILNIDAPQSSDLDALESLNWYYWNKDSLDWKPLIAGVQISENRLQISLQNLPEILPKTLHQITARWLKATWNPTWNPNSTEPGVSPTVTRMTAGVQILNSQLKLDHCFFNTVPLDLNKDFYPFGEQPRFNDTFYFANSEIFSKTGTIVTLKVNVSDRPVNTSGNVELAWEFFNGVNWERIGKSSVSNVRIEGQANFSDGTQSFSQSKLQEIQFTIPDTIQSMTINGINSYWLRARIVKGHYGTEASYRQRIGDNNQPIYVTEGKVPVYELVPETFAPPVIQSMSLSYRLADVPVSDYLSCNNFTHQVYSIDPDRPTGFQPFSNPTEEESNPTLYLGFDRPFPNRPIALYFQVEPPTSDELSPSSEDRSQAIESNVAPHFIWDYFNGNSWVKLNVIDETVAFADRGLVKFIGPADWKATPEFDRTLYWLRIRWESGTFRVKPRLRRILTNTIWTSQTTTLHHEILGSSNDNPKQVFRTTRSPILLGQTLEVKEPAIPPTEEQIAIEKLEGKEAITIERDDTGEVETVWVKWHEVSDFYESNSRDRHYTINRLTGEIQFGDGKYGLIPPQGQNNIRMTRYQTDGGARGNKPANAITQLKTTIPYIDRVTNLEEAGGGSDRESIDRVKERGQKFVRHRNRAVTLQDFEDLTYEASADIARVKAVSPRCDPLTEELWIDPQNSNVGLSYHQTLTDPINPGLVRFNPGLVQLFIVPRTASPQPIPSLALIDRVETYLRDRTSPTLELWIGSPLWLKVSVTAEVVPTALEFADAVRDAVIQRLETFLHPLTGGVSRQGWEFGRKPYESDMYRLIKAIDRVNYVRSISIKIEPELFVYPEHFLIFSGTHTVNLV